MGMWENRKIDGFADFPGKLSGLYREVAGKRLCAVMLHVEDGDIVVAVSGKHIFARHTNIFLQEWTVA